MALSTTTTTDAENQTLAPLEAACRVTAAKLGNCGSRANNGGYDRRERAQADLPQVQAAKDAADASLDTSMRAILSSRSISVPAGAVVTRAGTTITVEV